VVFAREPLLLASLLVLTFGIRAIAPDQPIVENYVGRQVPTAMVARNLDRGMDFLRPQLDTGPWPNLFLVEPPVFACLVVGFHRATGVALEPSGRLVSALAMSLAGWGIYGLARRRAGSRVGLWALAAFAAFPITLRYGRAFQPDALMVGLLAAGLRLWDDCEHGAGRTSLVLSAMCMATAIGVKIYAAYIIIPMLAIAQPVRPWKIALAVALLVPAFAWYVHAAWLIADGSGSRASADNAAIWLRVAVPTALLRWETYAWAGRFLVVRAFTPLGFLLAAVGLVRAGQGDRLWRVWGASALAALAVLAAKLHHEYYWLALAPIAAFGVGKALDSLAARCRALATAAGVGFLALSVWQGSSTWRTPAEWASLTDAAGTVKALVPRDAIVVAPEALLFASDRRGCRLEYGRRAALRAAGEWGHVLRGEDALALVEFYRARDARYVADLAATDPERLALHEAIRRRYNVLVDRPGVLLAELTVSQVAPDGTR
jgi:4-amino-4-deoxy-L-arabinose transferase-like glycosyltransferase